MIDSIQTAHGDICVRTTSLGLIELRTYVQAAPNSLTVLHLNQSQAEALQSSLARMRGMLPCPHRAELMEAIG